jgi:transposase
LSPLVHAAVSRFDARLASSKDASFSPAKKGAKESAKPSGERVLTADRAYDSDKLRGSLLAKGWDLVCPHRRGRIRPKTQDGRKLRRYRRRWKIERTIAWVSSFRRLIVRHEYYSFIYQGFIHLACILICLRRF